MIMLNRTNGLFTKVHNNDIDFIVKKEPQSKSQPRKSQKISLTHQQGGLL